jgi:hypothetical protein
MWFRFVGIFGFGGLGSWVVCALAAFLRCDRWSLGYIARLLPSLDVVRVDRENKKNDILEK